MKIYETRFYVWLMRRFRVPATCASCPHWIAHSRSSLLLPGLRWQNNVLLRREPQLVVSQGGVCRLDRPRFFNQNELGFAFKLWDARDTCARHPLHVAEMVPGSDLRYQPHAPGAVAGYNRAPTLDEAFRLADPASLNAQLDALKAPRQLNAGVAPAPSAPLK